MLVVRGTRKFLDRVGRPTIGLEDRSTTALGDWYATVLFWKPWVALFVNETTLLPVLTPFAPAVSVIERFGGNLEEILGLHGLSDALIESEIAQMAEHRLATTNNRSVVGVMNEFARLAEVYLQDVDAPDLSGLSLWLASTPCGPLYSREGSPDRELAAFAARLGI